MTGHHGFIEISPLELNENPFRLIGKDWLLLTAAKAGKVNTMTISWGGLGVMWNKNVVFVTVRPERHTFEFIRDADTFSLSSFGQSRRQMLAYCGSVSGRTEDKIAKSGLTTVFDGPTPYFAEARLVMTCRKLMHTAFDPENFLDKSIEEFYGGSGLGGGGGYHTLFIAEIEKTLIKK